MQDKNDRLPLRTVRIAGSDDDWLLRAEAKVTSLLAALARFSEDARMAGLEHRLIDDLCTTVDWVRRAKPNSLAGAAAKLRVMLHPELAGDAVGRGEDLTAPLRDVLAVIERAAATPGAARRTRAAA